MPYSIVSPARASPRPARATHRLPQLPAPRSRGERHLRLGHRTGAMARLVESRITIAFAAADYEAALLDLECLASRSTTDPRHPTSSGPTSSARCAFPTHPCTPALLLAATRGCSDGVGDGCDTPAGAAHAHSTPRRLRCVVSNWARALDYALGARSA